MKKYIKEVLIEEVDGLISNPFDVMPTALDIYTNPKRFNKWFIDKVATKIEQEDLENEKTFDEIIKFISVKIISHYMGVTERTIKENYFKK